MGLSTVEAARVYRRLRKPFFRCAVQLLVVGFAFGVVFSEVDAGLYGRVLAYDIVDGIYACGTVKAIKLVLAVTNVRKYGVAVLVRGVLGQIPIRTTCQQCECDQ
jgi:hypothetical protein